LVQRRIGPGAGVLTAVTVLRINVLALRLKKPPPLPFALLFVPPWGEQ